MFDFANIKKMLDLQEITQNSKRHLEHYVHELDSYTPAQFAYKQEENTWSLGQMYEHISVSSMFFLRQAEGCLREDKGDFEGAKTPVGEQMFAFGGFPPIKIQVPEKYKPASEPTTQDLQTYQKIYADLIAKLLEVSDAIGSNYSTYKRLHAMFGMLTASEWIWCLETHLRHHFRQQEELKKYAQNS